MFVTAEALLRRRVNLMNYCLRIFPVHGDEKNAGLKVWKNRDPAVSLKSKLIKIKTYYLQLMTRLIVKKSQQLFC